MKQLILFVIAIAYASAHHDTVGPYRAIVKLASPSGGEVSGNVTFTQQPDGKVHVEGTIFGLGAGNYGFHVHEKGDITGGCLSTGPHFNPFHKSHGHPGDENRHVGDLGNIVFDENRVAHLDFFDDKIALVGANGILGRGLVLHEKADDFGRTNHPDSRTTGNAGSRVACGVIGILSPVDGWQNSASTRIPFIFSVFLPLLGLIFNQWL